MDEELQQWFQASTSKGSECRESGGIASMPMISWARDDCCNIIWTKIKFCKLPRMSTSWKFLHDNLLGQFLVYYFKYWCSTIWNLWHSVYFIVKSVRNLIVLMWSVVQITRPFLFTGPLPSNICQEIPYNPGKSHKEVAVWCLFLITVICNLVPGRGLGKCIFRLQ